MSEEPTVTFWMDDREFNWPVSKARAFAAQYEPTDDDERAFLGLLLDAAEAAERGPSADALMDDIRRLGARVLQDGAWPTARLAEVLGVNADDGTLGKALRSLVANGEWEAEGSPRARVYRPNPNV